MNNEPPREVVDVPPPTEAFLLALRDASIELEPEEIEQLRQYLTLLYEANQRFNLTAVRQPAEAWMRHIFDGLTLLPILQSAEARTIADVGSGGGLPGLVLAITMPDAEFTLIEVTGKKAAFLRETAEALRLRNVRVVADRAENVGRDRHAHRDRYDAVVSRAVGKLSVLAELTVPLARIGGLVLAVKGEQAKQEVEDARQALYHLHASVVELQRTPTGTIIVIEKRRATPRLYPRSPGEPKRKPLS